MLKLKNINKTYCIAKKKTSILDNVNLSFKNSELVYILGASGSGKSTLLNIIGGNLKCDSGEIYFNNLCITKLKEKELTIYRHNIVSTIFQDYNLIEYLSVYDNITLASHKKMTSNEIDLLLKKMNIYDKKHVIANKLSGGEKQRVAIARTLAGNPKIILADEPTGALDSRTSNEVMELLKQIAKDKLVIVVTHNIELANKYGGRIITIKDGKCKTRSVNDEDNKISLNKYHHKFKQIIKLALKSLISKPFRNLLTSVAMAIGLISIILVTNIYSNFNQELNDLETSIVSIYPITIKNGEYIMNDKKHTNKIDENYLEYLNNIKEINHITYHYDILFPIITDSYHLIPSTHLEVNPHNNNYELLYGSTISHNNDVLLKVSEDGSVDKELLTCLGLQTEVKYEEIIGKKLHLIANNQYFTKEDNYYIINDNYQELYNHSHVELTIVGIVKEKETISKGSMIIYEQVQVDLLISENQESNIVKDLISDKYKALGFNSDKNELLSYLGYHSLPSMINIYTANLKDKQRVTDKLTQYAEIIYEDKMSTSIEVVRKFMLAVSLILIIFSLLSIIVSSFMISILTSIRVLESKKAIGILKSLGYSKKDIRLWFNLENILIGIVAFITSVTIVLLLIKPGNHLIGNYIGTYHLLNLNYQYLSIIFIAYLLLIKIVSTIPANHASKLDTMACIYG